jgi:hypothetical protein
VPNCVLYLRVATLILIPIVSLSLSSIQSQAAFGLFENLFGPASPCLSKKDIPPKEGYSQYANSEHKTQIQFPSDWIKKEENGKFGVGGLTPLYTLATLQPDTTEGFRSTLELEINDISKYTGDTKSLTGMGDFEKESIMLSPEATILSSNEIQINNCPAYQIVYLQGTPNTQEQWKTMLTFFIDCDKEYVMRYTATDNQLYDKYLETVSNMLQTFKVNGC